MQTSESLIFESIEKQGWAVSDDFLDRQVAQDLLNELDQAHSQNRMRPAQIGRQSEQQRQAEIRGDSILWLEGQSPGESALLQLMENFSAEIRRRFFMPIQKNEFHFALYPPGAGYKKHIDQHRGQNDRLISCVFYLNKNWQKGDGGELLIFSESDPLDQVETIEPIFARSVFFLSDRIAHEVSAAHVPRKSVTGWLRQ